MAWWGEHNMIKEALELIDDAFVAEGLIDVRRIQLPVVVDDSRSAMKAKTVKQMMLDLGLIQTFANPRTRNENPYPGSSFSTVKSALLYPS